MQIRKLQDHLYFLKQRWSCFLSDSLTGVLTNLNNTLKLIGCLCFSEKSKTNPPFLYSLGF